MNRQPSVSVNVHADADHISGDRGLTAWRISIESPDGSFPYVNLFLRDDVALEKLRDVCASLLAEAWVAS